MLKAIKKALAAVAMLVLLPVEIVVRGVRTIISILVPQRPTDMLDAADDFLEDTYGARAEPCPPGSCPPETSDRKAGLQLFAELEENRVRAAANSLLETGQIPVALLDPSKGGDNENILWLSRLTPMQLETVARARPELLGKHLNGVRSLPVPTIAEARAAWDGKQTDDDELSPTEWIRWITAQQHPDRTYDDEALERQARKLAAGGYTPARVRESIRSAAARAAAH